MSRLEKENELRERGIHLIAGVDEVGRGPFAGPVVAAAVILNSTIEIEGLTDSKKLSKKTMKMLEKEIKEIALDYAIGSASVEEVDRLNIKQATRLAMKRAVENLKVRPEYLLIDGLEVVDLPIPQEFVVKGDLYCHTISAASVIAKVYRDELMTELDEELSGVYDWKNNAGYLSKKHKEACVKHGLTIHHRKSWSTYNKVLEEIEKNK
ncbi:ribonuclease HII [[Brevibacterium] frigoritolerans]|nr:ribonuclease HII [Peribacillus frigoritolerans]